MNYQRIYERFRVRINADTTISDADKIGIKSLMLNCLWEQMSEDNLSLMVDRNKVGDILNQLIDSQR